MDADVAGRISMILFFELDLQKQNHHEILGEYNKTQFLTHNPINATLFLLETHNNTKSTSQN